MKRVCWLGLALTVACSDALEQTSSAGQVIGVVNAADNTVSFVSATDFSVRTVDLGTPGGAATTAAGRGGTVIVPLGPADSVAVIHNAGLCTTGVCVRPVVVFALPRGSGATGAVIRGDSPGAAAFHPSGRVLVASASEGILEVNTLTRSVTRGPGHGVKPGGHGVAGLAIDQGGRVYALDAGGCSGPGVVHILSPPPDYDELRAVTVGVCPSATALAVVP